MPSLVPALGAELKDLVVVRAGLFDQPLQADVAAHLEVVLVEGEESKEPRDAPVAVAEGVDTEEIQHQRSDSDERRSQVLVEGMAIEQAELLDSRGRLRHAHWTKPDDGRRSLPQLDDLVAHSLPLAG